MFVMKVYAPFVFYCLQR